MIKKVPKQFFLFLIVSILSWVLITLSKSYTSTINCNVNYINLSQNKLFSKNPPKTLNFKIEATGFRIIQTKLFKNNIQIDVGKLEKVDNVNYKLALENQKSSIQNQFYKDLEIVDLQEMILNFSISKLAQKKVVLIAKTDLNFLAGYGLVSSVKIEPDSILVSGAKEILDTLSFLPLKPLVLNNISQDFSKQVGLDSKTLKNLKTDTKNILVKGKVDKITEGSVEVEYNIKNVPKNIKINTLVKKINIIFTVSLSDFNKISSKSFIVECDYQLSFKENLNYLLPKIIEKPYFVRSIRIVPETIDFLIQK